MKHWDRAPRTHPWHCKFASIDRHATFINRYWMEINHFSFPHRTVLIWILCVCARCYCPPWRLAARRAYYATNQQHEIVNPYCWCVSHRIRSSSSEIDIICITFAGRQRASRIIYCNNWNVIKWQTRTTISSIEILYHLRPVLIDTFSRRQSIVARSRTEYVDQ